MPGGLTVQHDPIPRSLGSKFCKQLAVWVGWNTCPVLQLNHGCKQLGFFDHCKMGSVEDMVWVGCNMPVPVPVQQLFKDVGRCQIWFVVLFPLKNANLTRGPSLNKTAVLKQGLGS